MPLIPAIFIRLDIAAPFYPGSANVVVDFMILFRESVRVVQFTKKSCSFVCSFVRSVVFPVAVNHSVSRSDSLPPSAPRSHSRIANASRVVQTHFRPPSLVLVRESRMPAESFRLTSALRPSFSFANRECQPSRSDSLPPSVPRSRSRIANASRVVQTHFLPLSLVLVRESRMPAESVRLTSSLVHNIQTNHECTMQFSQLSLGQTPSFSFLKRITKSRFTIVQWCKWLSINTTLTKFI